jgi:hypothetical protein
MTAHGSATNGDSSSGGFPLGLVAGNASAVIVIAVIVVIFAFWIRSRHWKEQSSFVSDPDSTDGIGDELPETHEMTETYLGSGTDVGLAIDGLPGEVTVEPLDYRRLFASDTLGDRHRF